MKTNHRRRFKDKRASRAVFGRPYFMLVLQDKGLDGVMVHAAARNADACCGKHGMAKDRAGAKKFVRSRIRRRDRDYLKARRWEDEA
jgi:hypothetical protein